MDLKESGIMGGEAAAHWYYVSKGRAVRAMLGDLRVDEVLDVGAGSGIFARQLLEAGIARRAVCVDPGYAAEGRTTHHGRPIVFTRAVEAVPQRLLLLMDVLEHVDDDVGLLRGYAARMPRGGRALITVPAFRFLWSGHDVFLEHRRRYTLAGLEGVVRQAGLEILAGRYFFGLLFPLAALLRLRDRRRLDAGRAPPRSALRRLPRPLNALLALIHGLECQTLLRGNRLAGLSAVCLAQRP